MQTVQPENLYPMLAGKAYRNVDACPYQPVSRFVQDP